MRKIDRNICMLRATQREFQIVMFMGRVIWHYSQNIPITFGVQTTST